MRPSDFVLRNKVPPPEYLRYFALTGELSSIMAKDRACIRKGSHLVSTLLLSALCGQCQKHFGVAAWERRLRVADSVKTDQCQKHFGAAVWERRLRVTDSVKTDQCQKHFGAAAWERRLRVADSVKTDQCQRHSGAGSLGKTPTGGYMKSRSYTVPRRDL